MTKAIQDQKIQSTPTFVIGDQTMAGLQSLEQLDAVLQPMLTK